ncbi:zf-TFIIB domain-containing protein [Cryobacterium sp. TMB3-15]
MPQICPTCLNVMHPTHRFGAVVWRCPECGMVRL